MSSNNSRPAKSQYYRGITLACITMLLWGSQPFLMKVALLRFSAFSVSWFRLTFAFLIIFILLPVGLRIFCFKLAFGVWGGGFPPKKISNRCDNVHHVLRCFPGLIAYRIGRTLRNPTLSNASQGWRITADGRTAYPASIILSVALS